MEHRLCANEDRDEHDDRSYLRRRGGDHGSRGKRNHAHSNREGRKHGVDHWAGEFLRCGCQVLHRYSSAGDGPADERGNRSDAVPSRDRQPQLQSAVSRDNNICGWGVGFVDLDGNGEISNGYNDRVERQPRKLFAERDG